MQSCSVDCKEETIKKPIWSTHYEEYWVKKDTILKKTITIDTLVPYRMTSHRTKKQFFSNNHGEVYAIKVTHYITIQNNNDTYWNSFAIRMTGHEGGQNSSRWTNFDRNTGFIQIGPYDSYTFTMEHSDMWRDDNATEGDVQIYVLQKPTTITYTKQKASKYDKKCIRRIDELTFRDTVVNNCECDIDALKAEYKAIQQTYEKLKKEKLIEE